MSINIIVVDKVSGNKIEMNLDPESTIGEVITDAADYLNKSSGVYLIKYKNRILSSDSVISKQGLKSNSILELLPDPQGG